MNGNSRTSVNWHRHFADILLSGDAGEVDAAAAAALDAERRGAHRKDAAAAGKDAAKQFRNGRGVWRQAAAANNGWAAAPPVATQDGDWSTQLAPRLFAPPARWGWETVAPAPVQTVTPPLPPARPAWAEPQRPDTSALYATRSKAITRVVWRLAFTVTSAVAFTAYQLIIEQQVAELGSSAGQVYPVVLIVVAALLALSVLGALGGVRLANRNIRNFEQPYLTMRAGEHQRFQLALQQWEQTKRQHATDAAEAARAAAQLANGPRWFPVHPKSEPTRVDVFGGDPHRHGWASLLALFGSSLLAAGNRVTVLDFTGQQVGDNLATLARTAGMRTRTVHLGDHAAAQANLLHGVAGRDLAECLGHALTSRPDGDRREERSLVTDVLRKVVDTLDGPMTFARLAAGLRVLFRGTGDEQLSEDEITALAAHIGDVDQNEWTARQLRFAASQLDLLHDLAPATAYGSPLWTTDAVSLISTDGGRDDRKQLIDRVLVQLAQRALDGGGWLGGFLVVAGADHLGAATVQALSEHARQAKVRLVLMIESPQGDLEKSAGTGGAVCFMKMYNHRDANIAAEFIGKEHKFVINQVTRQVGTTFTDGGGDSFAANTSGSNNTKQRRSGMAGRGTGLSDSRGHTWTGTRNWSNADNLSTSTGSSRVYEFAVEPREILGMPETAFFFVDNTGGGRSAILADCNPGICLLPRVSAIPAAH